MASFGAYAKKNGVKYFLISFVDCWHKSYSRQADDWNKY